MQRTDATYGQLDKVLRAFGFSCQPTRNNPPGRRYAHPSGAIVLLPDYPESDQVYEHHLITVRAELDHFGLAEPSDFAAQLQKAG